MDMSFIQKICIWAIPVLFAITLHEVAHGYVALKCGDKTAQVLGRLTLNPIKHIDLIGTVIVPLVLLAIGGFLFGWAKPIPVNPNNLRSRRHMALVSVAGPLANLLMALFWGLIMKLGIFLATDMSTTVAPLIYMGQAGMFINLMLFLLNMIPLPPLDGGRFVSALLPGRQAYYYDKIEPFGFIILLVLLVTGILTMILGPVLFWMQHLLGSFFGLLP